MKKILAIVTLAALVSIPALAQHFETISLPAVVAVANNGTNLATKPIIDVTGQQNVTIAITVSSADAASTTNVLYTLQKSVDGSNWDTNAANLYTVTGNVGGGNKVVTTTNITVGGINYLRVGTITIGANSQITNNLFRYSVKPNAP